MWVIDFEASGLSAHSYPIEVGLTNGKSEYQALIRPLDHWRYWSPDSEKIHNIKRSQLETEGLNAVHVARKLNEILGGNAVYCDCLNWDSFWCDILFNDTGVERRFELRDISSLIADCSHRISAYCQHRELLQLSGEYVNHRALDDAAVIWRSLNISRDAVRSRQ